MTLGTFGIWWLISFGVLCVLYALCLVFKGSCPASSPSGKVVRKLVVPYKDIDKLDFQVDYTSTTQPGSWYLVELEKLGVNGCSVRKWCRLHPSLWVDLQVGDYVDLTEDPPLVLGPLNGADG